MDSEPRAILSHQTTPSPFESPSARPTKPFGSTRRGRFSSQKLRSHFGCLCAALQLQVPPFRRVNRSRTCAPVLMLCRQTRCLSVRSDPTVTAIVCNAASPLLRAACASVPRVVHQLSNGTFRSRRRDSTQSHFLNMCVYSVLNMFTSLHDARSAQRTRNTPVKDANTLCCRCDAVTRRVQQSASEHQSPFVPLIDDVCSSWLARWRRRQTVRECCGRPRIESAMLVSCSDTLFDTITQGRAPKNAVEPSTETTTSFVSSGQS